MRHHPEIVKILDASRLIDSESYEHAYWTGMVPAPRAGYYVVHWPDEVAHPRFDEHARFTGPFPSYAHARLALEHDVEAA